MSKLIGKVRNPFAVVLLMIITFGIYGIFWHYFVFEELRNHRGQGWSGITYLIFAFVPPLQLILIAVPWLMPAYVGRTYVENNQSRPISGYTGFWALLPIVGAIVWFFRVQGSLNKYWDLCPVQQVPAN